MQEYDLSDMFKAIVRRFVHRFWLRIAPFTRLRVTAVVTGQQGILTPPKHLIPPVVYLGFRVCHALILVFFLVFVLGGWVGGYKKLTVRYLCLFLILTTLYKTCVTMKRWSAYDGYPSQAADSFVKIFDFVLVNATLYKFIALINFTHYR